MENSKEKIRFTKSQLFRFLKKKKKVQSQKIWVGSRDREPNRNLPTL